MKGAIASVEVYARRGEDAPRRLTLTITAPERSPDGTWTCRVALADLHRPEILTGRDSVAVLAAALTRGRAWLDALRGDGSTLHRDRAGKDPFELP